MNKQKFLMLLVGAAVSLSGFIIVRTYFDLEIYHISGGDPGSIYADHIFELEEEGRCELIKWELSNYSAAVNFAQLANPRQVTVTWKSSYVGQTVTLEAVCRCEDDFEIIPATFTRAVTISN